jgi:biopolymer transport protein ExbB/biopolymer transport protein TolQ
MTMMDMWSHMGYFAKGIVIVLILMSVVSFSIGTAKWLRFRRMAKATRAFAPPFSQALEQSDIPAALALTKEHSKSHVALVLGESLREVAPLLEDPRIAGAAINSAERSIEREQILLANDLKAGMSVMATVAATAPFVGLLGTTWGVITAFQGMATAGGGLEAISAGIAEALVTTAIGLIVAITAVWLYNYFTARVETLFTELAYAGREMIDWMMTRQAKKEAKLDTAAFAGGD